MCVWVFTCINTYAFPLTGCFLFLFDIVFLYIYKKGFRMQQLVFFLFVFLCLGLLFLFVLIIFVFFFVFNFYFCFSFITTTELITRDNESFFVSFFLFCFVIVFLVALPFFCTCFYILHLQNMTTLFVELPFLISVFLSLFSKFLSVCVFRCPSRSGRKSTD